MKTIKDLEKEIEKSISSSFGENDYLKTRYYEGKQDLLKEVKEIIIQKIINLRYESTMLLGLFNSNNLTSIELREHRAKLKELEEELGLSEEKT